MDWKEDLKRVLELIVRDFENRNYSKVKKDVERIIHSITIYKEKILIETFLVMYSLGKIIERVEVKNYSMVEEVRDKIINILLTSIKLLDENKFKEYLSKIEEIWKIVYYFEKIYGEYIESIKEKAKVRLGYLMYRHGVSLHLIKEILGIHITSLLYYIGKTESFKDEASLDEIEKRIRYVEEVLE